MDRGVRLNVVDGPVSWRASPDDPPGTEENGSLRELKETRPKLTGLAALWCDEACGAGGGRSVIDYRATFVHRAESLPRERVAPCRSLRTVFAMTAS